MINRHTILPGTLLPPLPFTGITSVYSSPNVLSPLPSVNIKYAARTDTSITVCLCASHRVPAILRTISEASSARW